MNGFYMFEQKNIKKIISSIILSCVIFLPSVNLASEHESTQQKKQTKYDIAKNLANGAARGYVSYLSGTAAHEFGHWLVGKMIHRCNGFFYVHPSGRGGTLLYHNHTNKDIIMELLKRKYIKNYQPKLIRLDVIEKPHPLVIAAGPLFGIGYDLFVQRLALQSCINNKNFNMLGAAIGSQFSFTGHIWDFSPFNQTKDGHRMLEYFNINCPTHQLVDFGFGLLAASAALMLGAWNIRAVLPSATT